MTQAFDDYAASRTGPRLPDGREFGHIASAFITARHYERMGDTYLRDVFLAHASVIAEHPVDTAQKT